MTDKTSQTLELLLQGQDLSEQQAFDLMMDLAQADIPQARAGALLAALRAKGESAAEIRGFATAMRRLAIRPAIPEDLRCVDVVGTGGDNSGSYNLSTGSALLIAACGVPVAKHGNRSVSSQSGSADLLAALGMKMPMDETQSAQCLLETGFAFFFAPYFHPAMKAIAPIRQAMGVRTVFNFLGPLSNPAAPPLHFIGAYSDQAAKLMADSLSGMEQERSFVVHGEPGWDEATPVGSFALYDVHAGKVSAQTRSPEDYGLPRCSAEALEGGNAAHNAQALRAVFTGADKGAHRDALLMSASLTLELVGEADGPRDGVARAQSVLESGKALALVEQIAELSKA